MDKKISSSSQILTDAGGWLNLNKPLGWTSTSVVALIKRISAAKKVGHGGTLDPLASGVLPIAINGATKQTESLMDHRKKYEFDVTFGETRTTGDAEGEIEGKSDFIPSADEIRSILDKFSGVIEQVPPLYSALKIGGRRACDLARKGQIVELKPRRISIYSLEFLGFVGEKTASFRTECGRGCYIRSLAVDMARQVGALGYVSKLTRVAVGDFRLAEALAVETLSPSSIVENLQVLKI